MSFLETTYRIVNYFYDFVFNKFKSYLILKHIVGV